MTVVMAIGLAARSQGKMPGRAELHGSTMRARACVYASLSIFGLACPVEEILRL